MDWVMGKGSDVVALQETHLTADDAVEFRAWMRSEFPRATVVLGVSESTRRGGVALVFIRAVINDYFCLLVFTDYFLVHYH